jgi:hypothetical protein
VIEAPPPVSFRLGLQSRQMCTELPFGEALAPLKLLEPVPYLRVDRLAVFREPPILLLLGLQEAEQNFFNRAGTA